MDTRFVSIFTVLLLSLILDEVFSEELRSFLPSKTSMNFTSLASKYGYKAEYYEIVTDDGYKLGLFHIQGKKPGPILLMHGIADTSDTWLLRGKNSLGITLAEKGYDVWFGNIRGNKYSRQHKTLNPNKDSAFWQFSFHEHGYYDLKAIVDTVLSETKYTKLTAIGHSQGNTIFYVLGSTRPEYNDKINVLVSLAPVCYLSHAPSPLAILIKFAPEINTIAKAINLNEIFGNATINGKLIDLLCNHVLIGYPVCALGALLPLSGFDVTEFGPAFYKIAIEHFPSSTTRHNLYHFAQVARRKSFSKFDYGPERNMKEYKSVMPPDYELKSVTMPVVLLAANNDKVCMLEDVQRLRSELPNVENYQIIERYLMNHFDYVWGENMPNYLFPHIFRAIENI